MKFEDLQKVVSENPMFDLAFLVQAFDEPRANIRVQLTRWMAAGRVISLRRGMYTLAEPFRKKELFRPALANAMLRPSYLSGLWALGFYGLIPEQVHWFTSVTSKGPRHYENPLGVFEFRHIKQSAFFGYERVGSGEKTFLVASPEKALLDHWHLHSGEWTDTRLEQMRYQNTEVVNPVTLRDFATRFASPRLQEASEHWIRLRENEKEEEVLL